MKDKANPGQNALYVVATPIGNLSDASARALSTLGEVDWIAAEDTRETVKLLNAHGVSKPLISFHEYSKDEKVAELLARLEAGESGAYVSDAGTPGISDPGSALVSACHAAGIRVVPIPGASAITTLLSASGFSASHFEFHGFFPREKKPREEWCEFVKARGGLHVFFESPHRVKEGLNVLAKFFPDAALVMGRELTKHFETITSSTPAKLAKFYEKEEALGEFVFVLSLPEGGSGFAAQKTAAEIAGFLQELVVLGGNQKLLVAVAREFGMAKNEAYELALHVLGKS